jgi:uncharacterized protein YvpB
MNSDFFKIFNSNQIDSQERIFPSYTLVHLTRNDYSSAKFENIEKLEYFGGLFAPQNTDSTGVIESEEIKTFFSFDSLVISLNAQLKNQSFVLVETKVKTKSDRWSKWYKLAKLRPNGKSESFASQNDAIGMVDVDTLCLSKPVVAFKYRVTLKGNATLGLVAINLRDGKAARAAFPSKEKSSPAWGKTLNVPKISQMQSGSGDLRERICSPSSIAMVLGYWGIKAKLDEISAKAYDNFADIYGNWILNSTVAGTKKTYSFVHRFNSINEAEKEILRGRPLIVSIAYEKGELPNSPIPKTKGHLVVIVGFDKKGNFIVNDPAANAAGGVRRTYNRKRFAKAWLKNKNGVGYKIFPSKDIVMSICTPVVNLYSTPKKDAKRLETQLLMGDKIRIIEKGKKWSKVESLQQGYYFPERDGWTGYRGWIENENFLWENSLTGKHVLKTPMVKMKVNGEKKPIELFLGTYIYLLEKNGKYTDTAVLPGSKTAKIPLVNLKKINETKNIRLDMLKTVSKFKNTRYFWGGICKKGIDCSGLTFVCYKTFGINLPRNAEHQCLALRQISPDRLKPADLIFLSSKKSDKITHVMIYAGGEKIFESARETGGFNETTFSKKLGRTLKSIKYGESIDDKKIHFATVFNS